MFALRAYWLDSPIGYVGPRADLVPLDDAQQFPDAAAAERRGRLLLALLPIGYTVQVITLRRRQAA